MALENESRSVDLSGLRERYTRGGLSEEQLPAEPEKLLVQWILEAVDSRVAEPNAMTLSTVKEDGTPDSRMVLLKGVEEGELLFFTNYDSEKGRDLEIHPTVSGCLWWPELERQIRFQGGVDRIDRSASETYFSKRPRESQIGAWASNQSEPVADRAELQRRYEEMEARFEGEDVPCPENWGGYSIRADRFEFWQGRPGRFHDRILFTLVEGQWNRKRLSP